MTGEVRLEYNIHNIVIGSERKQLENSLERWRYALKNRGRKVEVK